MIDLFLSLQYAVKLKEAFSLPSVKHVPQNQWPDLYSSLPLPLPMSLSLSCLHFYFLSAPLFLCPAIHRPNSHL